GCSVHVVVAKDRDCFARLHGVSETLCSLIHVLEAARVRKEVADLRFAMASEILASNTSRQQQFVDECIHTEAWLRLPAPAPRLPGHRPINVESRGHSLSYGRDGAGSRVRGALGRDILWIPGGSSR